MRKIFYSLFLSLAILTSCEKEDDLGNFESINVSGITNSSAYIYGDAKVEAKIKGLIVGEQPNVTETNGIVYSDEKSIGKRYSFSVSQLFANTKYYFKVFYTDQNGNKVYSPERLFTTQNLNVATVFGKIKVTDTVINQKNCFTIDFPLKETGGIRIAEYGLCYDKTPNPTIDSKRIVGVLDGKGVITCDMSSLNFYDTVMVRPYCKSEKGIEYGNSTKYAKPIWINCGIFPGLPCQDPSTLSTNGKGYVFVGMCPDPIRNDSQGDYRVIDEVWSFDSQSLAWSKETSLKNILPNEYRISMKTAETSNGFLFFKGRDYTGTSFDQIFSYDIAYRQCTQILPNGIPEFIWKYSWGSDGFSFNGKSYVVLYMGGYTFSEIDLKGTFIYSYDEANKVFTLESNNPDREGISDVTFFQLGECIYVGSGSNSQYGVRYPQDFWSYNLTTKIWTKLKDTPIKTFKRSFTYKNRCFAIGCDKNLYEYKPDNDTWVVLDSIKDRVDGIMTFDNGIYLLTTNIEGKHDGIYTNFERYVTRIKKFAMF